MTPCLYCGEASDGVGGGARALGGHRERCLDRNSGELYEGPDGHGPAAPARTAGCEVRCGVPPKSEIFITPAHAAAPTGV